MSNGEQNAYTQLLTEESEFQEYIRSFASSSSRVRFVLLAITVTSILLFFGLKNSHYPWALARMEITKIALDLKGDDLDREICSGVLTDDKIRRYLPSRYMDIEENRLQEAVRRACGNSKDEIEKYFNIYRNIDIEYYSKISVPFLGISFDANDLGIVGGLAFSLLFVLLALSLAREHENLFLCLWKVEKIADSEGRWNDGESKANFLYHALVMTQGILQPSTLARWQGSRWMLAVRVLLFVPLGLELWILVTDWMSREVAQALTPVGAWVAIISEVVSSLFIFVMTLVCLAYSRAQSIRWRSTFFHINPGRKHEDQVPWIRWMLITKNKTQ